MSGSQKSKRPSLRDAGVGLLSACSVRGGRGRPGISRDERGATAVEYAIMVSLIAIVIVASVTLFGQNMIQLFQVPASAF